MVAFKRGLILTIVFLLSMAFLPVDTSAQGLGPFHLPAVGFNEMFRETPMFISPYDHCEGKVQFNMTVRWFNVW